MVTEAIPLSSDYFTAINGTEGRTLKYIEEISGARISLGKMKNGLTGFTSTGFYNLAYLQQFKVQFLGAAKEILCCCRKDEI